MRDPVLPPFSGNDPATESWLNRVRENLGQLLIPSHFKPSSANGAPIHLLKFDKSLRPARAQGASLLTHAAVFAAIVFLLANTKGVTRPLPNGEPSVAEPVQAFRAAHPQPHQRASVGRHWQRGR